VFSIGAFLEWSKSFLDIPGDLGPQPMQDMPDRLMMVTLLPGAGLTMDDMFDRPSFQVAIRGDQFAEQTPEADMRKLDYELIKGLQYPHALWGDYVVTCSRTGGGPSPIQSYDKGRRVTYTCTYWVLCDL
jgi:hypothetical protein